jgi:hypothetical protein
MSSSTYNLFEGAWPVLKQASTPYTDQVFKDIQIEVLSAPILAI